MMGGHLTTVRKEGVLLYGECIIDALFALGTISEFNISDLLTLFGGINDLIRCVHDKKI